MKNKLFLLLVLLLTSCTVEVGNFSDERIKLHEMGQPENYCQQNPDRCIHGVPW